MNFNCQTDSWTGKSANEEKNEVEENKKALTLSVVAHIVRDSCMAMRQKAVMEASDSTLKTSPCTFTHSQVSIIVINTLKCPCLGKMLGSEMSWLAL